MRHTAAVKRGAKRPSTDEQLLRERIASAFRAVRSGDLVAHCTTAEHGAAGGERGVAPADGCIAVHGVHATYTGYRINLVIV